MTVALIVFSSGETGHLCRRPVSHYPVMTVKQPVSREIWQLQQEQICVTALQTSGAGNRLLVPLFTLLQQETDCWCHSLDHWNRKQIFVAKFQVA